MRKTKPICCSTKGGPEARSTPCCRLLSREQGIQYKAGFQYKDGIQYKASMQWAGRKCARKKVTPAALATLVGYDLPKG